jgi:hypothetical protein
MRGRSGVATMYPRHQLLQVRSALGMMLVDGEVHRTSTWIFNPGTVIPARHSPAIDFKSSPPLRAPMRTLNPRVDQGRREKSMNLSTSIAQMFAALSATNEAILRAKSEDELFQRVCDAAVFGGKLLGSCVLLAERENLLKFVAGAGREPTSFEE